MKKIFLISSIILAFVFVSCEDELIETSNDNVISFDNSVDTRAIDDITADNIQNFNVYGWMVGTDNTPAVIFDNTEVKRSAGNVWTYGGGDRYWFSDRNYSFLALAPVNAQYEVVDYQSFTYKNSAESDLIVASAKRTIDAVVDADDIKPVYLHFYHLLSRVIFNFVNEFEGSDVKLAISDVTFSGLANAATFLVDANKWKVEATADNHTLKVEPLFPAKSAANRPTNSVEIANNPNNAISQQLYIIPETTASEYKLTFTITKYQSEILFGTFSHVVAVDPATFEPGRAYKLTAKIDESNIDPDGALQPITFTVQVLPWGEDEEASVDFPGE